MNIPDLMDANVDLPWVPSLIPTGSGADTPELQLKSILQDLAIAHTENNGFHKNDNIIEALNNYLQYYQNELNYSRDLENRDYNSEGSQVSRLMASGMSRAAALQSLQGSATQINPNAATPSAPAANNQLTELTQAGANVAGAVSGLGNMYAAVSSLPFDKRVKAATADILSTQNTMLSEQRSGQSLAAAAIQSISNLGFDFEGANATSIMDYMQGVPEFGSLVTAIRQNPYAFAALSDMCSKEYGTRAESYSPQYAEFRSQQQRALAALTSNDAANIDYQNTLLANQVFRDNVATALYQAVEYARANNFIKNTDVDNARLDNILQHIKEFNEHDLEILRWQLNEAKMMNNPEVRKARLDEIINSSRFQAAQALHGFQLTNLANQVFTNENTFHRNTLISTAKDFLYGVELGDYQSSANARGWITAGASALGAVSAICLAGFKIFGPKVITPPMYQGWTPDFSRSFSSFNYNY